MMLFYKWEHCQGYIIGKPWSQDSKLQGKGCYLAATQDSEQVISGSWNLPLEVGGSIRFVILKGKSWKL